MNVIDSSIFHSLETAVHHGSSGGYGSGPSYDRPPMMYSPPVDSGYGFARRKVPRRKVVEESSYGPQEPIAPVAPVAPVAPPMMPITPDDGYSNDAPIVPVVPRKPMRPTTVDVESNGYGSYGEGGYGSNANTGSSGY